ncbi:NAD(P)/FAD-dependent oxidoreductase [Chloroflexi bacterium CFX6]|nr:NAD(P)/FAD-dependent oxidoreductase [Chloroflexi bacterium CFX6]
MNTTTAASKPGPAPTPEPSHAENEILIVGGGPGGLSTALHLHRIAPHLTPRILILEKGHYPRPKLCAGGLTLDAEVILERLGLDVNEVPHADAENIHFDFESKGLNVRVPKRHALRIVRRDEFDNWLADKTRSRGIEIREGITARNVIPDADGVTVETDQGIFRAQVVVGADGSNGVTRRCVFPHAPVYTARVLEVLTPSLSGRDGGGQGRGLGSAYFEFSPVPDNIAGYVWDFPTQVKGRAMRCWGIYDTNILADEKRPQLKEPLAQEMSRLGFDLNDYQIKGHPIRWFSPRNQMSAPRVLLVGDAAGADPLFGEGISVALGYGALAAREIQESYQRGEFSFGGYRRRVGRSAMGRALIVRWVTAKVVYSFKWKWFQILLWRILKPVVLLAAWLFILNWGRKLD